MKTRKLFVLFLVACVLFCSVSCANKQTSSDITSDVLPQADNQEILTTDEMNLLYCAKDSLNPFESVTKVNKELSLLLFDSLIKYDNEFNLIYVIAEKITVKDKLMTVKLKNGVKFSNGDTLKAQDVVASFLLAKKSKTSDYTANLVGIKKCEAKSDSTVIFTLEKYNPYAQFLLDFPIIQSGTEDRKDKDNVALPPIGSGRYVIDASSQFLTANKYYSKKMQISRINLTNTPDDESANHSIKVGNSDIYYNSTADKSTLRMADSDRIYLNTTNLVYLGANMKSGVASNIYVRYAVSAALDRKTVCGTSYYSAAVPANGIFHPDWEDAKPYQTIQSEPNNKITIVNLKEIGYNSTDNEGFAVNSKGKRLKLSILVNSDNESRLGAANLIASQLCSAGIDATVNAVPFNKYVAMLKRGEFDLYLAEVKLTADMDITQLVNPKSEIAFGIPKAVKNENDTQSTYSQKTNTDKSDVTVSTWQIIDRFYNNDATVADIVSIFESELPLIPVCYLFSSLFYTNTFSEPPVSSVSDIFLGIENYKF